MDQVFIENRHADSRVVDVNLVKNAGLRVYRDSPFTITVQVRTKTAKQGRVSSLTITAKEAREIAGYLLAKAEGLRDEWSAA